MATRRAGRGARRKAVRSKAAKRKPVRKSAPRKAREATTARAKPAAAAANPAPAQPPQKARRQPESLRLRSFSPGFTVADLSRSVDFYTRTLGFIVAERWVREGALRGVLLKAGRCEIGLSQDDWAKGRDRRKGEGVRLWCETSQDVDEFAARLRAAGVPNLDGPKDQTWGARSVGLDDPDGFHLTFFRPLGERR
jgi:catechol 2,3-dioxygenase-like lactoylglutathione lyase family enzyme